MFWKVELDKQGAILTCEVVESKGRNGGCITYVEAETKVLACSAAKAWHANRKEKAKAYSAKVREKRAAKGKCTNHGNVLPCARCAEKNKNYRERVATGTVQKPWYTKPEDALRAKRLAQKRFRQMLIDIRVVKTQYLTLSTSEFASWLTTEVAKREAGQPVIRRRPGVRIAVSA